GALCVQVALERGHDVTAFSRNPQRLELQNARLRRQPGDFHQQASVDSAVKEHDAVIVTASATSFKAFKENPTYFSQGTAYVVDAMKASGVKRLVILSALGVGESAPLLNPVVRFILVDHLLNAPYADHLRQEKLAQESGLEWVIARPGRLTNGKARG